VLNPNPQQELVNTQSGYEKVMNKFQFRGLNDSTVYNSDDYRRAVQNHRNNLNVLAESLLLEGDSAKAREVLLLSLDKMPDHGVRYDITSIQTFQLLLEVGERERALEMSDKLGTRADALTAYYLKKDESGRNLQIQLFILQELTRILYAYDEPERGKKMEDLFNKYVGGMEMRRRDM
jgi:hypothetical protein